MKLLETVVDEALETVLDKILEQEGYSEACSVYNGFGKVLRGSLNPGQAILLDEIEEAITKMAVIEIKTATDTGYKIGRGRITSAITSPVQAV